MKTSIYPIFETETYDSAYSAILASRDGSIYFGLCTHMPDRSAGVYKLDPKDNKVKFLYNTASVISSSNPHGKIHSKLVEDDEGNIYYATHFAYPYGLPQDVDYEGGRLLKHSKDGGVEDLGIAQVGNGVINIEIDKANLLIYLLTIPDGHLIQYDITGQKFTDLGTIPSDGSICRSMTIDEAGNVYGAYEGGGVFIFDKQANKLRLVDKALQQPEEEEWNSSSRGGVNRLSRSIWRNVDYDQKRKKIYGLLSTKSLAFSLDPADMKFESYEEMLSTGTSEDRASKIYPTLSMTATPSSLAYATSNGLFDYCRSENMEDWSHLVVMDKDTHKMTDLGIIEADGRRVFGVGAATAINAHEVAFLGAVETKPGESYNRFNIINKQPFQLAIIRVSLD